MWSIARRRSAFIEETQRRSHCETTQENQLTHPNSAGPAAPGGTRIRSTPGRSAGGADQRGSG
jgi:hypothetical protein